MKGRIVVKIGSNVLSRDNGTLDQTRMSSLVDQVVALRSREYEVILVTSGAVACGRSLLKGDPRLDSVRQRQLYSAVGQVRLINIYHNLFREYGVPIGQVLTMKESFSTRKEYLNQRNCMEVMLANGVVPVVNENDTISVTELMFTDNDELSGLVASMMDAEALVILSNIDGIYNGAPSDPASEVIRKVGADTDLSSFIQAGKSSFGRGGMLTKTSIAQKVAQEGIRVIIANGKRDNVLVDLFDRPESTVHTEFVPSPQEVSSVKKWIQRPMTSPSLTAPRTATGSPRAQSQSTVMPLLPSWAMKRPVSCLSESHPWKGISRKGTSSGSSVPTAGR